SEILMKERVIAILRGARTPRVEPIVEALRGAGLTFIEITFEAQGGAETIAALRSSFGGAIHLGAGTIVNAQQAQAAVEAGAQYLVSPGLFEDVSTFARRRDVLHIPGVLTATEIGLALRWGHPVLKLFPAGLMGPEYLRAMRAPYPEGKFFAVGNIGPDDIPTYLRAGAAGVALGSQLAGRGDDPDTIAARARTVVDQIRQFALA
ncbi:MAG: bifunctional 4-hydroxy-2-oxoglutarate aldolase/2-dehydro-3-deoxy-phosphogluconate aldolase, partial [Pseudomonadota bacterium]